MKVTIIIRKGLDEGLSAWEGEYGFFGKGVGHELLGKGARNSLGKEWERLHLGEKVGAHNGNHSTSSIRWRG